MKNHTNPPCWRRPGSRPPPPPTRPPPPSTAAAAAAAAPPPSPAAAHRCQVDPTRRPPASPRQRGGPPDQLPLLVAAAAGSVSSPLLSSSPMEAGSDLSLLSLSLLFFLPVFLFSSRLLKIWPRPSVCSNLNCSIGKGDLFGGGGESYRASPA